MTKHHIPEEINRQEHCVSTLNLAFFLLNRQLTLKNTSQSKWELIYQWKLQKSSLPCASGCSVCELLLLPDYLKLCIARIL
jgi:hypothetical protein